jgi:hypothetical protein
VHLMRAEPLLARREKLPGLALFSERVMLEVLSLMTRCSH